jgi:hypothetical protein
MVEGFANRCGVSFFLKNSEATAGITAIAY